VEISIYEDRTFSFITKTPPTPVLIREAIGLEKGSQTPGRGSVGVITNAQIEEIARTKMPDLNTDDIAAACLQVAGTARSMGLLVQD
jgi:large subunit ribosomal protein L11